MTQIHNMRLSDFADRAKTLSREEFERTFPNPFLIVERNTVSKDSKEFRTISPEEITVEARQTQPGMPPSLEQGEQFISSLEKSTRNSFGNMITVGRSSNNDVVIDHGSVSKLHAVFKFLHEHKTHGVQDVGSTNGTFMGGQALTPNTPYPLDSGTSLTFGGAVAATFFTGPDLFDYLELLRRTKRL